MTTLLEIPRASNLVLLELNGLLQIIPIYHDQLTLQRFTVKLHLVVTQHQLRVALVQIQIVLQNVKDVQPLRRPPVACESLDLEVHLVFARFRDVLVVVDVGPSCRIDLMQPEFLTNSLPTIP